MPYKRQGQSESGGFADSGGGFDAGSGGYGCDCGGGGSGDCLYASRVAETSTCITILTFRRRIKSRLPFAGIIRSSPYSTRFQDKG